MNPPVSVSGSMHGVLGDSVERVTIVKPLVVTFAGLHLETPGRRAVVSDQYEQPDVVVGEVDGRRRSTRCAALGVTSPGGTVQESDGRYSTYEHSTPWTLTRPEGCFTA